MNNKINLEVRAFIAGDSVVVDIMNDKYELVDTFFVPINKKDRIKLENTIYQAAVEHFGEKSQIIVAIEEMSELIKELTKWERGIGSTAGIAEEIADVEIMLQQLKYIFLGKDTGLPDTHFDDLVGVFKQKKKARLLEILQCLK